MKHRGPFAWKTRKTIMYDYDKIVIKFSKSL